MAEWIEVKGEHVTATGDRVAGNGIASTYAVPVQDGGWLSPAEVGQLRGAIGGLQPGHKNAKCCDPRHAFLFYDASGRYLGYLTICFECGCSEVRSFQPPGDAVEGVSWNEDAVGKIASAHGLSPAPPVISPAAARSPP